jgi:hypothetical protein
VSHHIIWHNNLTLTKGCGPYGLTGLLRYIQCSFKSACSFIYLCWVLVLLFRVARLIVEPNAVHPNDNRCSSMRCVFLLYCFMMFTFLCFVAKLYLGFCDLLTAIVFWSHCKTIIVCKIWLCVYIWKCVHLKVWSNYLIIYCNSVLCIVWVHLIWESLQKL